MAFSDSSVAGEGRSASDLPGGGGSLASLRGPLWNGGGGVTVASVDESPAPYLVFLYTIPERVLETCSDISGMGGGDITVYFLWGLAGVEC